MQTEIASGIRDFSAREWNRLAGSQFPFLRHEFLLAAEACGSVTSETGWTPRHLGLRGKSGKLQAVMPLYEKTHSWGEFVFDWSWAQAYQQAGLDYYPKLVSTVPFTPAPSPRFLVSDVALIPELIGAARQLAIDEDHSSFHVLFPDESELDYLQKSGLRLRKDCQFHWHNRKLRQLR